MQSGQIDFKRLEKAYFGFCLLVSLYIEVVMALHWHARPRLSRWTFALSLGLAFIIGKYLFAARREESEHRPSPRRLRRIIAVPLLLNLTQLALAYYAGYETGAPPTFFKVGWHFGNFMDYFEVLSVNSVKDLSGLHEMASVGYFPLIPLVAKLAAFRNTMQNYFSFFAICTGPLCALAWNRLKFIESRDPIYRVAPFLLLMTSYPVLFLFERGNFVLLSLCFLSLAMIYYPSDRTKSALFISLLLSVKVLNLVFLPFLFLHFERKHITLALLSFLGVSVGCLYLLTPHLTARFVIGYFATSLAAALHSPIIFSDAAKLVGTSTLDAARATVYVSWHDISGFVISETAWFKLTCLAAGGLTLCVFYWRALIAKRLDMVDHGLLLVVIPLLFHPEAADYSMVLLLPFFIILLGRAWRPNDGLLARVLGATCVIFSMFPFHFVAPDDIPGRMLGATVKTFIVPALYAILIYVIVKSQDLRTPHRVMLQEEGRMAALAVNS